jgi:DNA-binding GntR family transcriptional regulator
VVVEEGSPGQVALVDRCVDEIRSLIIQGVLLPGERIRQGPLADHLGVSKIPVREALKVLQAEWVVTHQPNVGFAVARFAASHLAQIYLMRASLEAELLQALPEVDADTIDSLRRLNVEFAEAGEAGAYSECIAINRRFHFTIFEQSTLDLVRAELGRLWDMSEFYRSLYAYDPAARDRILEEHGRMVDAIARHDNEALVAIMQAHREGSRAHVMQLIRPQSDASVAAFLD